MPEYRFHAFPIIEVKASEDDIYNIGEDDVESEIRAMVKHWNQVQRKRAPGTPAMRIKAILVNQVVIEPRKRSK